MRTFRDDYPDIVDQLVDLFLSSTPPLLDELRDAAAGGDRDELKRAAHKLKGSCQNIGATFMATLCRSIETAEGDVARTVEELDAALASDRDRDPARADVVTAVTVVLAVAADRRLGARLARAPRGGRRRDRAPAATSCSPRTLPDVSVLLYDRELRFTLLEGSAIAGARLAARARSRAG